VIASGCTKATPCTQEKGSRRTRVPDAGDLLAQEHGAKRAGHPARQVIQMQLHQLGVVCGGDRCHVVGVGRRELLCLLRAAAVLALL